jgi:hypothetical protein
MPRSQFRQPPRIFTESFTDLINKQKPREELTPRLTQPRLPLNFRYSQLPGTVKAICAYCGAWYQAVPKRLTRCRRCQVAASNIIRLPEALLPWQLLKPGNDPVSQYANIHRGFTCRRCGLRLHNWAVFGCLCNALDHAPRMCRICCVALNPAAYGLDAQTPGLPPPPPVPTDPRAWFALYHGQGTPYDVEMYTRYLVEVMGYSRTSAAGIAGSLQMAHDNGTATESASLYTSDYDGDEDEEGEEEEDNY